MISEYYQVEQGLFARWLRATFWGWLLGFVLIVLGALVGGILGMGESQLVGMFLGGVALGAVSAGVLVWILRRPALLKGPRESDGQVEAGTHA